MIVTGIVAVGIKESAVLSHVLTAVNVIVIALILIFGFTKADIHNWRLSGEEVGNRMLFLHQPPCSS